MTLELLSKVALATDSLHRYEKVFVLVQNQGIKLQICVRPYLVLVIYIELQFSKNGDGIVDGLSWRWYQVRGFSDDGDTPTHK